MTARQGNGSKRRNGEPGGRRRRLRHREAGVTLLEMLIVIAIIAVLATLVGPRLFGQLERSKVTAAHTQVRMLRTALDTLRLDLGRYPTGEEALSLLTAPPSDPAAAALWFGPYLDGTVPNDPWGNPYRYRPPANARDVPNIFSYGADNQQGGDGPNADISSNE